MKTIFALFFFLIVLVCFAEYEKCNWDFLPVVVATIDGKPVTRQDMREKYPKVLLTMLGEKERWKQNSCAFVMVLVDHTILLDMAEENGFFLDIDKTKEMLRKHYCMLSYPGYTENQEENAKSQGYKNVNDIIEKCSEDIEEQKKELLFRLLAFKFSNPRQPKLYELQDEYELCIEIGLLPLDADGNKPAFEVVLPYLLFLKNQSVLLDLAAEWAQNIKKERKIKYFIPIPADLLTKGESAVAA